jgi:hypothetical protein
MDPFKNIEDLNALGQFYHTGDGFYQRDSPNEIYTCSSTISKKWYKKMKGRQEHDDGGGYIDNTKAKELAQTEITFDKITLMYKEDTWYGDCKEWWNVEYKNKRWKPKLSFLNTRKYIKVIDPFMKVEIDSKEKGSPITIDDILFAGRALAIDNTRTYEGFEVISADDNHLILEPDIDNYST